MVAENEPTPRFGHALHTRGMIKFARPDLVTGVPPERVSEVAAMINSVAGRLADGAVLEPGQVLNRGGRAMRVLAYQPGRNAPELELNNDALLLGPW